MTDFFENLLSNGELQEEIAELKAEKERLKEEVKEVKKYQYEQEYLDKEIEEMQKALKTLAEGLNKRQILLQEIKKIAERQLLVTNVRTYQMVYYADFSEYRNEILQKITKAEEE